MHTSEILTKFNNIILLTSKKELRSGVTEILSKISKTKTVRHI